MSRKLPCLLRRAGAVLWLQSKARTPHAVPVQSLSQQAARSSAGVVHAVVAARLAVWQQACHISHASASHRGCLTAAGGVGPVLGMGKEDTTSLTDWSTCCWLSGRCPFLSCNSGLCDAGVVGAVLGVGKGLSGVVIRPLKGLALSGMDIGSHAVDAAVLLQTKRKETFLITKEIVEG